MKTLILLTLLSVSLPAFAEVHVEPSNLPKGWSFAASNKTIDDGFSNGREGFFNFVSGKIPSVDLKILPLPIPANLGADVQPWHALMFSKPATSGIDIHKEITFEVNGQRRYYIEFQTKNSLQVNTAMMATVIDGKLVVMVFDMLLPDFNQGTKDVRKLTRQVELKIAQ